jgi:hypothetical protein
MDLGFYGCDSSSVHGGEEWSSEGQAEELWMNHPVTGELMAFQVKGKGKGGPWKGGYGKGGYTKGGSGKGGYGKGFSKGGGKGGPFTGKCYNCGREGHRAGDCPDLGKGFKGACFTCGGKGHRAAQCPAGKGSGGGDSGNLKSIEEETGDQTNGTYSILPSSVGQALSLGGYLAAVQKHENKHAITIGDCQWSVAGKRGKKTKTLEETSRSVGVLKQIQNDQEDRKRATRDVNVGVLRNRYEAIKPDEESVLCGDLKCGNMKHNKVIHEHSPVNVKEKIVPRGLNKLVPKHRINSPRGGGVWCLIQRGRGKNLAC